MTDKDQIRNLEEKVKRLKQLNKIWFDSATENGESIKKLVQEINHLKLLPEIINNHVEVVKNQPNCDERIRTVILANINSILAKWKSGVS